MNVQIKRVYDPPTPQDGRRILIDRLWPRGVKKETARVDRWLKEIAPSDELRRWFGHTPSLWEEFQVRYAAELDANPDAVGALRSELKAGAVTLVFAAKDAQHSNAAALKAYLEKTSAPG